MKKIIITILIIISFILAGSAFAEISTPNYWRALNGNVQPIKDIWGMNISGTTTLATTTVAGPLTVVLGTTPAFYVNSSNGNVGIGKSSASYKLDVATGGIYSQTGFYLPTNLAIVHRSDGAYAPQSMVFYGTTSVAWMTLNNGNLGIGTISPAAKLHVYGNSGTTSTPVYSSLNITNPSVGVNYGQVLQNVTLGSVAFNSIGLHIDSITAGGLNYTSVGQAISRVTSRGMATGLLIDQISNSGATAQPVYGLNISNIANNANGDAYGLLISNVTSTGASNSAAGIIIANSVTSTGNVNNAYSIYSASTNKSYFAGNIGIGTSPSYPLDINGQYARLYSSAQTAFFLTAGGGAGQSGYIRFSSSTTAMFDVGMDSNYGNSFMIAKAASPWTRYMTIIATSTGEGNMGIGVTSPSTKLEVAGVVSSTGIRINGDATTTGATVLGNTSSYVKIAPSSTAAAYTGLTMVNNQGPSLLKVGNGNGYGAALVLSRYDSDQQVYIGSQALYDGTANDGTFMLAYGTKDLRIGNYAGPTIGGGRVRFFASTTEAMRIETNGNNFILTSLGIGVTPSIGKIHVLGGAIYTADTAKTQLLFNSAGTNFGRIQNDIADTWSLGYGTVSTNALGNSVLTWNASGNVGIGTTTPRYVLDIRNDENVPLDQKRSIIALRNYSTGASSTAEVSVRNEDGSDGGLTEATRLGVTGTGYGVITGEELYQPDTSYLVSGGNIGGGLAIGSSASGIKFFTGGIASVNRRMTIDSAGKIGIGTTTPTNLLDVWGNFSVAAGVNPTLYVNTASNFIGLGTSTVSTTNTILANSGARLTSGGVWTNASDKNSKENFKTINEDDILGKLMSLSITKWNYKAESSTITHIGPTAQDFFKLFGLGGSDTSISTIDPASVALASIKSLYHKIEMQFAWNLEQDKKINDLQRQINELKQICPN